ncbi:hypothetical protein ACE7GA_15735 [Roseomonas sp. CCTCC AB2023176]|uniref:hypothetical protein n=1 Tax=Roseomonas sp. CCTCC AB2023176 TaxID=3342640 RepID=UPI0035D950E1
MTVRRHDTIRRAGGRPLALLLFALLLATPVRAEPSPLDLAGQPVRALAFHPDLAIGFRSVVRGRQSIVYRHLHAMAPGLTVRDARFVYGWTCDGGDCARNGLFLGYDLAAEQFFLLLLDAGEASLTIPPRGAPWPAELAAPVLGLRPDLRRRIG